MEGKVKHIRNRDEILLFIAPAPAAGWIWVLFNRLL